MADRLPPLGIEDIDRKYELLAKMGEGGMGEIYRVRHTLLDEIRVIKTIRAELSNNEDLQARFLREARIATQLRHRNIAAIYDFSVGDDGTACIVMEYIDGKTLLERVEAGHRPDLAQVVEIGCQTLEALDYLHGHEVVHRDISPDNIMLTTDHRGRPRVKLIDMGIAKPLNSTVIKTATAMFIGKVRYASPEQLRTGSVGIDGRSDLYSLGVVLYELLTGELAVTGTDQASMIAGHLFQPPRSFEETDPAGRVPMALRRVLLTSLAKERDERYPDAAAFVEALRGGMRQSQATGAEPTRIRPAGGPGPSGGDVRPAPRPGAHDAPTLSADAALDPTQVRSDGEAGGEAGGAGLDPTLVKDGGAPAGPPPTRLSGAAPGIVGGAGTAGGGGTAGRAGTEEAGNGGAAAGLPPTVLSGSAVAPGEAAPGEAAPGETEPGETELRQRTPDGEWSEQVAAPTTPPAARRAEPDARSPAAPRRPGLKVLPYAAVAALLVAAAVWFVLWQAGPSGPEGDGPAEPETAYGLSAAELAAIDFGTFRALVIGNDSYASLPPLQTAVRDAREVARTLEEGYGFEVTLLTNVDRYELVTAVAELAGGAGPGDNLLVYYAGHGDLDRKNETAYWQGVDADPFETTNWVSTKYEVSALLDDSLARHVLVMADSCYSGAMGQQGPGAAGGGVVTASDPAGSPRQRLEEQIARRARIAFTSGSLEPVIDTVDGKHSVFADALLGELRKGHLLLDAPTLFTRVREEVEREAAEQGIHQLPDLAPIPRSDHEGGNFFFVAAAS